MEEFKKFEDFRYFGKLFAIKRFKDEYVAFINGIMRDLYKKDGNWGQIEVGDTKSNTGVINTQYDLTKAPMNRQVREFYVSVHGNKDPNWSLLNYVNTNWGAFMHIVNTLNYWIYTNQIEKEEYILFKDNYFDDLNRMKMLITKQSKYLFLPQERLTCFYRIMGAIATSTYYGDYSESKTLEVLSNLGDITDVIKSRPGQRVDTHGGVDISFKLNGIPKTLQCKSFYRYRLLDGNFIFTDIPGHSYYRVDYFSFVNRHEKILFLFDSRKHEEVYKQKDNTYIFNNTLLKFKTDI